MSLGWSLIVVTAVAGDPSVVAGGRTGAEADVVSESADASTGMPAIYVKVERLRLEIDAIRHEMGRPEPSGAVFTVRRAAPRDVFAAARTLWVKSDRFAEEQTGARAKMPKRAEELGVADIDRLLVAARERVRSVGERLGLEAKPLPDVDADRSADDVLLAVAAVNRQLNLLLERPFAPSDVYKQVTLSVRHSARLLSEFPEAQRIPEAPPLERGKRPADVYRRLLGCYAAARAITRESGRSALEIELTGGGRTQDLDAVIAPTDVFDLAALVVAELEYLVEEVEEKPPNVVTYFPGRKLPSHVFQRVGVLEAQLEELDRRAKKKPDWLGNRGGQGAAATDFGVGGGPPAEATP